MQPICETPRAHLRSPAAPRTLLGQCLATTVDSKRSVGQLALGSILRRSVVPRIEGQTKMEREGVGGVDLLAAAGSGAGEVFNMTSGL